MRAYFVVFILTLLSQLIPAKDDKNYRIRLFFTFLPLFLFGALRVDFGLDYTVYEDDFYWAHYSNNLKDAAGQSEIGYVLLNKIIPTWRLFLALTSALVCVSYGMVFYRCIPSKNCWLAVCLLFLAGDNCIFFMFSGIRNAIAISIMLMAFSFIRDRKWLPYALLFIVAMFFHTSAIFFMPVAFLIGFSKPMSKLEAIVWVVIMFLLQITPLDVIINKVVPFVDKYFDRYGTYVDYAEEIGENRTFIVRITIVVFTIFMIWFMRTTELNKNENSICRLMLLYSMTGLLGVLNVRMAQCYGLFFVCGNTLLICKWKEKFIKFGYAVFLLLYLGYAFFKVFMGASRFPYQVYHSVLGVF